MYQQQAKDRANYDRQQTSRRFTEGVQHLFSCSSAMLPLMLPMAQHSVLSEPQAKSLPFIYTPAHFRPFRFNVLKLITTAWTWS